MILFSQRVLIEIVVLVVVKLVYCLETNSVPSTSKAFTNDHFGADDVCIASKLHGEREK